LKGSKIPKRHIEVWETVRKAQYAAYLALVNTSSPHFAQLDAAARDTITAYIDPSCNSTQPDYSVFTTRLGHGIGLDGHESPFVNQGPQGEREVKAGHVFSIEPGIYIPSDMHVRGLSGVGVRLEDCFVVTDKDGKLDGEWLTGPVSTWGDI
jgi:Xaa-Pro aminopeptidase